MSSRRRNVFATLAILCVALPTLVLQTSAAAIGIHPPSPRSTRVQRSPTATWYHRSDHPAHALFRREGLHARQSSPDVGSPGTFVLPLSFHQFRFVPIRLGSIHFRNLFHIRFHSSNQSLTVPFLNYYSAYRMESSLSSLDSTRLLRSYCLGKRAQRSTSRWQHSKCPRCNFDRCWSSISKRSPTFRS